MRIGELIKNYRIENNLSRAEFGKKVGYSREYIRILEEEEKDCLIPLDKIEVFAKELKMPFSEVVKTVSSKQKYKNKTYYKIYLEERNMEVVSKL